MLWFNNIAEINVELLICKLDFFQSVYFQNSVDDKVEIHHSRIGHRRAHLNFQIPWLAADYLTEEEWIVIGLHVVGL